MAATDHSGFLAQIGVPTLVLVGEHDTVTGTAESAALAAGIPGARMHAVPDAGHAAAQEQPALVNQVLRDFFDEVETAEGRLAGRSPA
jgi:pimeloyl-ACP methyl ester carboxylesterase